MFLNINCKQFMFRNIPFLIFMVEDFSLKIKSASSNICAKFSNSRWMKMAKIGLPKGSGKWLKVREKSVKSQGILKWILSGSPALSRQYLIPDSVVIFLRFSPAYIQLQLRLDCIFMEANTMGTVCSGSILFTI